MKGDTEMTEGETEIKFNLKNRPKINHSDDPLKRYNHSVDSEEWFEGFYLETIPRLLKRLDSYRGCIPVDVALQIVREEILGE